jgi:type I restriction enzyme R subunit
MNKGKATPNVMPLQSAIFQLKFEIVYKLQDIDYQTENLIAFRKALVAQMVAQVQELSTNHRNNFAVRQHIKFVDLYANPENYNRLTYEDTLMVREELSPLILADGDEVSALRFDALMYGIELAYLIGKKYARARSDLYKRVSGIAKVAGNIPEIMAQEELIQKILHTDYVDTAGINQFEEIRERLRDLMKYIKKSDAEYHTTFHEELLSQEWRESELENDDLQNYKAKAEFYVRTHQDHLVIAKLKSNQPLTRTDITTLEQILWSELGSKEEYEAEYGQKPLGEFVREIVGLDMNAAKEAFSMYLYETNLDSRQIYFVNQIIEYIVHNGMMKDFSVMQDAPFTDRGSIVDLFADDIELWTGIRGVIERINANADIA